MATAYSSKRADDRIEFILNLNKPVPERRTWKDESLIRSHAAKVSHARRRANRRNQQLYSSRHSPEQVNLYLTQGDHELMLPPFFAGNSDPFSTAAITITPQINLIMSFLREAVCPALYGTPFYRNCSASVPRYITIDGPPTTIACQAARRSLTQEVRCLSDEGTTLASLAPWCDLLPHFVGTLSPRLRQYNGSEMRARSVKLLREKLDIIANGALPKYDHPTFLHIFFLFQACTFAGEFGAAAIHAGVMRSVVEEGFKHGAVDFQMLIHFLYVDSDSALKSMRRTLFDLEDWIPKVLDGLWTMTESMFPPARSNTVMISTAIKDDVVLNAISHIRYVLGFLPGQFTAKDFVEMGPGDLLFASLSSQAFVDQGRLVNRYLSLIATDEGPVSQGCRYTQACLALSVLFVTRIFGHTAPIHNVDLRDASPVIMSHLKPLISKTLLLSTEEELLLYGQAHLWILYVIALYDQRVFGLLGSITPPSLELDDGAFGDLLAAQAQREGVSTWRAMQRIEALFIQTELIQPSGEYWFEELIGEKNYRATDSGHGSSGQPYQ